MFTTIRKIMGLIAASNGKNLLNGLLAGIVSVACATTVDAAPYNPDTDWMRKARLGAFVHFLPSTTSQLAAVAHFDTETLADQLANIGAGYLVITLGQNSGYYIAPNSRYSQVTGYLPGERCSTRDLPMDLAASLSSRGIKLLLYLPCQTPCADPQAQKAFGVAEGVWNAPINIDFALRWAEIIQEWSDHYSTNIAGWWFDGGYASVGFNDDIAQVYSKAVKHGNPNAIVAFNPGILVSHLAGAEDYTAGELNEPFGWIPKCRWLAGSQWHALTYLGHGWALRDQRYPTQDWVNWAQHVVLGGGVVTLDMGPNWESSLGPIGSLSTLQMNQFLAIKNSLPVADRDPVCDNSFFNGSFELPGGAANSFTGVSGGYPGWTVGGTYGVRCFYGMLPPILDFPPIDGSYQISFNDGGGPSGTWIRQTFETLPGESYIVTFFVGAIGNPQHQLNLTVSARADDGTPLGHLVARPPGHGYGTKQEFGFKAKTTSLTIECLDTSTGDFSGSDLMLDSVQVALVRPALSVRASEVSEVAVSWVSEVGRQYQLQYQTNACSGVWINLGSPLSGSGGAQCIFDNTLIDQSRVYRVLKIGL
jgi:hypothetical protein